MASTIITSIVTGGTNSHATTNEEANFIGTDFITAGVNGSITLNAGSGGTGSFAVNADASPDMGVTISAGSAYLTATPTSQNSQMLRARMAANYTSYTINANSSGSTKYDFIYLSVSAVNANTPSSAADNVTTIVTSRSTSSSTDNGTPPTYGLLLAVVIVANGASSITNGNITDKRTTSSIGQATSTSTALTTGWVGGLATPNTVTYNGQRSYSLVFNSSDLTGTLSEGMKLALTRTVSAPTQCTSLNGTTQYFNKTSPAGMTFTDTLSCSAWVKPTAYAAGTIISRYNGTSGWSLYMNANGTVALEGNNAGGANYRAITSYQSIPLNKWTHVFASFQMSDHTSSTCKIAFDGVDVPAVITSGGTAPTALIQAGNLEIGSQNGGTTLFTGSLAQVAVFSAVISEATNLTYMSQTLAGTESNLVSAYSFNSTINDLNTTNANNLTAQGSAAATTADSPFTQNASGKPTGTTDYGIIMGRSFSTNTTLTVQVPEGCMIPTSGGISAVSYSTQASPYGYRGVDSIIGFTQVMANSAAVTSVTPYLGLTTTVYVPPNRRVRITGAGAFYDATSTAAMLMYIYKDGVQIQLGYFTAPSVGSYNTINPSWVDNPSAGSHTYSIYISSTAAMTPVASTNTPAYISVELLPNL